VTALSDAELIARARARQPALIAATQALVRLDTQTPPSDTSAAADFAAGMLAGLPDVDVAIHVSTPPVTNLVARLKGGLPGPRLVLNGHLDTYPIGEGVWTHPPLGGVVEGGRLYGRGSADMKGACVTLIETVRLFADCARPFPGEIVLALAGDEERMGELGTQWLIDHVPEVRGDGVIVADVGGPHVVRLGEKGMIWLDLRCAGRQAHGAHVHAGDNAADRLMDALTALRALADLTPEPDPQAAALIAAAASEQDADGSEARAVMGRVTVNLGRIAAGASSNLVGLPEGTLGADRQHESP
jgi:succinyl-diaminopimelate desuccinylase